MANSLNSKSILSFVFVGSFLYYFLCIEARDLHSINFKHPQLFPEGFDWDTKNQHFIVGSLGGTIHKVSDAGVIENFIKDEDYAGQSYVLGITVDSKRNRFLAVIHREKQKSEPHEEKTSLTSGLNALAAYNLKSGQRIFFAVLDGIGVEEGERAVANDVAVDPHGNAYVTNSAGNFIWKVSLEGEASVFSKDLAFTSQSIIVDDDLATDCGLNGIVYDKKGSLLVGQSNSGKIFKVDLDDGRVSLVETSSPLAWADGMVVRKDGVLLVVSHHTAWFLKSPDNWDVASVVDEVPLNKSMFATAIAIREDEKAYVLNSFYPDVFRGVSREEFSIQEIEFPKEAAGEKVWIIVLIFVGLLCVFFWRFQMGYVIKNMNKKRV